GPGYILPAAIVYSVLVGGVQLAFTHVRHWRQGAGQRIRDEEEALSRQLTETGAMPPLDALDLERLRRVARTAADNDDGMAWYRRPFDGPAVRAGSDGDGSFDPVMWVVRAARDAVSDRVDVPVWLSPLMNALDMEYRDRLNRKVSSLEMQVQLLRERARELGIDERAVGGDVAPLPSPPPTLAAAASAAARD
ncbi:hypothetical protein HK405_014688, partial [Cladochytrium tenue]